MVEAFADLSLRAGEIILDIRARGAAVMEKADHSPVTEADRRAEALILAGLAEACPGVPVVAEEAASAGHVPATLGDHFILVDPLDGTREFIAGRPDFTVNIALIERGSPIAGVVYAPMRRTLWAASGHHAWSADVQDDGTLGDARGLVCRGWQAPPCIVASVSHRTPETDEFIARFDGATMSAIGSSLKFCLLAEGEADLYPRYGRTMEWDTAAGDAVLRAAGGVTITLDEKPLVYGKRNQANDVDFANPFFISASREGVSRIKGEVRGTAR
ncbi:3'(2'),5'-bisphosphate nucleotidase [Pseudohoeflea suaedae]|uniref:3'(2'),5'-bisphosphate nucleotidase CysQ n=2 Tax=Pseudohoeflea suaedae TaxID=877384 RepID=A0A4R5PRF4_9HYPH|nr:3'(2'),5'-bisphosphate nucleotidase [Pseudohoeflea suaedae]